MIQKSFATLIHLDRAGNLSTVVSQLDNMSIDIIDVDYNAKSIEISKPADSIKIADLAPVCSKENISTVILKGFKVWWKNPKVNKGEWYGKA